MRLPSSLRPARLAQVVLAAVVALPLAALSLLAGPRSGPGDGPPDAHAVAVDRTAIAPGDTVLGDVLVPGRFDEFTMRLPQGTVASFQISATAPAGLQPAIGFFDGNYQVADLLASGPTTASSTPLRTSGTYRFVVGGQRDTLGGYRLKLVVKPAKSVALAATGDAAPNPAVFGAFAGADVDVALRWKGPSPVTVTGITGPDAVPLVAAEPIVSKPTSSLQRGFRVSTTGDQTVAIAVPAGTQSWSLKLTVRTPKFVGSVRDERTVGIPERPGVELVGALFGPVVRVVGEEGGPNDIGLSARGPAPDAIFPDNRSGNCGLAFFDGGRDDATIYRIQCSAGFRAELRGVVRNGANRITSYDAHRVTSPFGSGSCEIEDVVQDDEGFPVSWKETRRFDATGNVHVLVFSDVRRNPANDFPISWSVTHTPPGGAPRTYHYAPFTR